MYIVHLRRKLDIKIIHWLVISLDTRYCKNQYHSKMPLAQFKPHRVKDKQLSIKDVTIPTEDGLTTNITKQMRKYVILEN